MSLRQVSCLYRLPGFVLLFVFTGLHTAARAPVVPVPVAPVRKAAVKPDALPSVKFVDITKDAGIAFVHYNEPWERSYCRKPWARSGVPRL